MCLETLVNLPGATASQPAPANGIVPADIGRTAGLPAAQRASCRPTSR